MSKFKACTNPGCGEKPIEEFTRIGGSHRYQSQCKDCLTKKRKAREKREPKPKKRVVGKMDNRIANDLTIMKWG